MSTELTDTSKLNLSFKKVLGKAQTSNTKEVSIEAIGSNISMAASTIFGYEAPSPVSSSFYTILGGVAEMVSLVATPIDGTKDSNGRYQAFSLSLPANYVANSSNPNKGSGFFVNGQVLNETTGTLQIIPPSFGSNYTALAYHTSSGTTQIPALDARDWVLDYYNGIFFQQDPPSNTDENPTHVDAFIYIGDYAESRMSGSGGAPGGAPTQLQFNNAGSFGASSKLTFNTSTDLMSLSGSMHLSGGVIHKRTAIATHYTASATDYIIGVTSVPVSIEFNATSFSDGQVVIIKDESGNASSTNVIAMSGASTQKIDGDDDIAITSPYGSVLLYTNGSNWFIY